MGGLTWPSRLRARGEDPDPRFSFANERTFLAWIRTALALLAAGIGLEAFAPPLAVPGLRQVLAAVLVLAGVGLSAMAFRRWLRSEEALRERRPLPAPRVAPWLSYGIAAVALVLFVLLVVANLR
ncbi:YidH family protein [Actinophytocola glycyrrhizae]|uniref:YidH family protein n=1 Tax=Actinophytocola glycyrrhizae TaxID=2044873 RepID=A0ABV9S432_9PSEU